MNRISASVYSMQSVAFLDIVLNDLENTVVFPGNKADFFR